MSYTEICEEMEGLFGLTAPTVRTYWDKAQTRLAELQSTVEETFWSRQVARLETAARSAWEQGDFIGQAALEAQLTKVAGTAAPERFIHQHQVAVLDVRAQQIDAELKRIRDAQHGPKAIAHQVSDLGVKNPEDITGANTASPEPPPAPVTERATRGNRTLGKIFRK